MFGARLGPAIRASAFNASGTYGVFPMLGRSLLSAAIAALLAAAASPAFALTLSYDVLIEDAFTSGDLKDDALAEGETYTIRAEFADGPATPFEAIGIGVVGLKPVTYVDLFSGTSSALRLDASNTDHLGWVAFNDLVADGSPTIDQVMMLAWGGWDRWEASPTALGETLEAVTLFAYDSSEDLGFLDSEDMSRMALLGQGEQTTVDFTHTLFRAVESDGELRWSEYGSVSVSGRIIASASAVPLPVAGALLPVGLAALGVAGRRRRRAA